MKNLFQLLCVIAGITISSCSYSSAVLEKRDIILMSNNNIKKFIRLAGSEEKAIEKLKTLHLPDTLYNNKELLLWYNTTPLSSEDKVCYASRKIQAFGWILKIYYADYSYSTKNENELFQFIDSSSKLIWDYEDLDIPKKTYFYKTILDSPTDHQKFYNELGYIKKNNDEYKELANSFEDWYDKMKINGLLYMRENKIAPLDSSKYIIKVTKRTRTWKLKLQRMQKEYLKK